MIIFENFKNAKNLILFFTILKIGGDQYFFLFILGNILCIFL